MGESSEFVIPVSASQEIRQQSSYIEGLFNVRLEFTSDLHTAQRTGIIWMKVTGQKESQKLAEVYVKGLANPETTTSFLIPENLVAIGSWNPQVLWHVQQRCGAVIRYQGNTNLLIQGSQLAVAQAVSILDGHINTLNQQYAARQAVNFMPQNTGYYEQSISHNQYYQGAISPSPATKPRYQTCTQQDVVAKGAHIAKNTDKQLPGDLNAERHDVASKSSDGTHKDLRTELFQSEEIVPAQSREFAVKLGYTDNQIDEALHKLKTSANSHAIGEDALLQQLIVLYPNISPPFGNKSESVVAQDSVTVKQQLSTATVENGQNNLGKKGLVKKDGAVTSDLRHIVIDGSNVAMSHGNRDVFSCKGINICVDYFKQRGHTEVTVFVPQWRKEASKPDRPIEDQDILLELEKQQILVFTPSRRVNGRRVVCYDDRYVVKYAADNDGIIVSNDNFKDLEKENPEWKKVIEQRLLMYAFVKDVFMPPDDPLGRTGPKLDAFLKKGTQVNPRLCPYGKRCTYGNKCKFYHPERGQNDNNSNNSNNSARNKQSGNENQQRETISQRISGTDYIQKPKEQDQPLRAATPTPAPMSSKFRLQLKEVFPDSNDIIDKVIRDNPNVNDVSKLVDCVFAHMN